MPISKKVAAPNALLLLSDISGGMAPNEMHGSLVTSTPTCIAIGCMSDCNGETEVRVGAGREVGSSKPPAFEGDLDSASRAVALWTIDRFTVLEVPVRHARTRVRIWLNHPSEPDEVVIGLD